jgi:hypothetical protein
MASRSTIRASLRRLLGADSDDPAYSDTILNAVIQEAVDSLRSDINLANPGYNSTTVTLTADSATSRAYTFATQSSPLTDFAGWLEVRWTNDDGLELHEVRVDELREAGSDHFAVTGIDSAAVLTTSKDSTAGMGVWMRYTLWEADLSADGDVPGGIPLKYHDVIALEALFAFALGGEDSTPPDLYARWVDRRGSLMHHVGKRGVQPSRTRIYTDPFE